MPARHDDRVTSIEDTILGVDGEWPHRGPLVRLCLRFQQATEINGRILRAVVRAVMRPGRVTFFLICAAGVRVMWDRSTLPEVQRVIPRLKGILPAGAMARRGHAIAAATVAVYHAGLVLSEYWAAVAAFRQRVLIGREPSLRFACAHRVVRIISAWDGSGATDAAFAGHGEGGHVVPLCTTDMAGSAVPYVAASDDPFHPVAAADWDCVVPRASWALLPAAKSGAPPTYLLEADATRRGGVFSRGHADANSLSTQTISQSRRRYERIVRDCPNVSRDAVVVCVALMDPTAPIISGGGRRCTTREHAERLGGIDIVVDANAVILCEIMQWWRQSRGTSSRLVVDTDTAAIFQGAATALRAHGVEVIDIDADVWTPRLIYHATSADTLNASVGWLARPDAVASLTLLVLDNVPPVGLACAYVSAALAYDATLREVRSMLRDNIDATAIQQLLDERHKYFA